MARPQGRVIMAEELQRSTADAIRLWIQAVGVPVVVLAFGAWQFWLKEVVWPAQAPVNLSTELRVKEAGTISTTERDVNGLQAIELEITAGNPSSRKLFLLGNLWVAHGITIKSPNKGNWMEAMEPHLNTDHRIVGGKFYSTTPPVTLAARECFHG
jgi:hypothetical protein